jgi:ParB-like chromosome segregation protein Spo0J
MKQPRLDNLTVEQLVERFTAITLDQDMALRTRNHRRFNRLFDEMEAVKEELKARDGDQRRALLQLYHHSNPQVRLKAVKATLAVAPEAALSRLKEIAESRQYPQAGEAGMSLFNLEQGIFKPS